MTLDLNSNSTKLTKGQLRGFGLVLGVLFGLISLIFSMVYVLPILGGICILLAFIYPERLRSVYGPWMVFGGFVGKINIMLILIITFYLVITPFALFFKVIGRDRLKHKLHKGSYWEDYEHHDQTLERYRRLF